MRPRRCPWGVSAVVVLPGAVALLHGCGTAGRVANANGGPADGDVCPQGFPDSCVDGTGAEVSVSQACPVIGCPMGEGGADAMAPSDVGSDSNPEDVGCRQACEAIVPDPLDCGGRSGVVDDCTARCSSIANGVSAACAACVRNAISYVPRGPSECGLGPATAIVGVTGQCAISACDTIFPCYGSGSGDTCAPISHCVQPCGPMQGADGICAFPQSGTCTCQSGATSSDACASGATCVCPSCGEGEGLCLTPAQRQSVCRPYTVDLFAQAVARFHCSAP